MIEGFSGSYPFGGVELQKFVKQVACYNAKDETGVSQYVKDRNLGVRLSERLGEREFSGSEDSALRRSLAIKRSLRTNQYRDI